MSDFRRLGVLSTFVLLLTAPAAGLAEVVRLPDLQALALRNHPAGAEAEALQQLGRAELSIARTWSDPFLQVLIGSGRPLGSETWRAESGFEVTQDIPSPLAYRHRIQAAEFGSGQREAEGRARRLNLLFDVEVLFYDFAAALEAARILEQNAEGAERILALTARRAELGEARETERIRAEVELLRLRRALAAAAQAVELTRNTLRRLVGPGLPDRFGADPVWPGAASVEDLPTLRARMAERNPELLAARAGTGESAEGAKAAAWEAWPDLAATYYDLDEIDKTARGAKLGIRVPLWNANRAEAARRRAEASLRRAELRAQEIDLESELDRAYGEYRVAADQADAYSKRLLPAAREGLRLTELTYEEGETSFLDLLDAQRTYREAAAELIGVRRDAARALAAIHRLTGGSNAADNR